MVENKILVLLGTCKDFRSGEREIFDFSRAYLCNYFKGGRASDAPECCRCMAFEWPRKGYRPVNYRQRFGGDKTR